MADKILKDKRKIFVSSVSEDTLQHLLDDALNAKVINQEEAEKVKKENLTTADKACDLIDIVTHKGHQASEIFTDHICMRDCTLACQLGLCSEAVTTNTESVPQEPTIKLKLCPREKFLEQCAKEAGSIYPIREKGHRTRLALIICNTEFVHLPKRSGSEHDTAEMEMLLKDLGYTVHVKRNLTAMAMTSVLREFAANPKHKSSDSTFLVFMSHGILEGICGMEHDGDNGDVLLYDDIFEIFNNCNCSYLRDKPKVIIVQACRGENTGEAWVADTRRSSKEIYLPYPDGLTHDGVHKDHVEKDFVAFFSSTPHNVSWRSCKGSFFIMELVNHMKMYSWNSPLREIFRMVQQSFEKPDVKVQMPTIERLTLTRNFYLFPGN